MDLLCARRVDPVHQSPRTKMYGYFTHGTDPPPRPCSSGFLSLSNCLRLPPSPTHFGRRSLGGTAFDCASDTVRQSDYWLSVARRFAFAYRSAYSGAIRDSASPPEVTHCSSVPYRAVPSASTLVRWVNE